ncbi:MAG: flagellar hook-associated protein FlgK [Polyangiales bacterium]
MNLGNVLSIGNNGLQAAAHGTNVASQNITNSGTPGYTRRVANLEPNPIQWGGGVRINGSSRVNDQFLEKRGLGARAYAGEQDARVKNLAVFDTVFSDGQGSIGEALDAFDTALTDLTSNPSSTAVRSVILASADGLGKAFHRAADALAGARTDANGRITSQVSDVNGQLDQIGSLNTQISQARNAGQEPGDLEDRRDALIRQVADAVPITTEPEANGTVTVMMAGARTLVGAEGDVHHLIASPDATSGEVRIRRETAGVLEDISHFFTSGSIGGTIAARDGALSDAQNSLDQLAFDVGNAYNTAHAAGNGLDGATGRNLFTPATTVAGAAANFGVSSDVQGQPANLAAGQGTASLPGDNRNALALLAVRDQKLAQGGTATAQQAFSAMVAAGGAASRSAQDESDHAGAALSQIEALRESASGVSTDEEMMNLMKYQRAYQASLRVIETADAMLSNLLNMRFGS